MLLHVPDVLTSDELRTLRSLLDEAAWRDGRATAGTQAVQAKNNEQIATGTDTAQAAQQLVLQALHRNPLFFSAALPRKIFPPQFNRYGGETNFYGDHVDGAVMHVAATGEKVRTDVSCTLFIADPTDYDGGELVIVDTGERLRPDRGDVMLIRGDVDHMVTPLTAGYRVTMNGFKAEARTA